jgi:hypothetical protein
VLADVAHDINRFAFHFEEGEIFHVGVKVGAGDVGYSCASIRRGSISASVDTVGEEV